MEAKVREIITGYKLINTGNTVLLGISGGADSIAMLRVLHNLMAELNFRIAVAHLNHGIRHNDADKDMEFVKALCGELQVPFYTETVNVPARAERDSLSIEMAAREERYEFFQRAAEYFNTGLLATAHTADDQAETVLLKLIRGSGIEGLSGIALYSNRNGLKLIRPLLEISRAEIESYLNTIGQHWRNDLSNDDTKYLRNKVRHELLPWIKENLNPAIKETLCRTANILAEENKWLNNLTAQKTAELIDTNRNLTVKPTTSLPKALRRRIIRSWLSASGMDINLIYYKMVEKIDELLCKNSNGTKYLTLADNYQVIRKYETLELVQKDNQTSHNTFFPQTLPIPGEVTIPELSIIVTAEIKSGIIKNCNGRIGQPPAEASLSFNAVGKSPIIIRPRKNGDKIKPLGINGTQKLQDIFVNERVPAGIREQIPIFECKKEIIWIPNYRVARGWEVSDDDKKSIIIKIKTA